MQKPKASDSRQLVSIGRASELLGVCLNTLRSWDEDGTLVPVKTGGNHRRYSMDDINRLRGQVVEKIYKKSEKSKEDDINLRIIKQEATMANDILISIKKAAEMLGVCPDTLRTWDRQGKLTALKTMGGHRRYRLSEIQRLQGIAG